MKTKKMRNKKILGHQRRARKVRSHIQELGIERLTVNRTLQHIYAQIVTPQGKVIAFASTLEPEIKEKISYGGNQKAALAVGELIAKRALKAGVEKVAFDRSGFKYHGRIKALADAARDNGLKF